jgi:hypothetical protein
VAEVSAIFPIHLSPEAIEAITREIKGYRQSVAEEDEDHIGDWERGIVDAVDEYWPGGHP